MEYGKRIESEEPGSSPHSLMKLCPSGSPSEEGGAGGGETDLQPCSLETSNRVMVGCRALLPEDLGLSPGPCPYYYETIQCRTLI